MIISGARLVNGSFGSVGPVTDGLKLFLDSGNLSSYSGTGSTWYDLSGNGYNSTINSGMSYSASNGGVFVFDGGSNAYAQVPPGFGYDYSAGLTINVWAKFTTGGGAWERLVDFGNGESNQNLILCRNYLNNTMVMDIDTVNDSNLSPGEMPITWDGWAMYTMYADGTYWKQYKNGQFYSYEGNYLLPVTATRYSNFIGRSNWAADAYYYGLMSVIQFYNRALTEPEILQNFNAFKGRYGL